MIIKSKPIKSKKNLRQVLCYIMKGRDLNKKDFVYTQFVSGDRKIANQLKKIELNPDQRSILEEQQIQNMNASFIENNEKREIPRINGNIAYHEIVSFNEGDANKLDKETMLKIAKKYIEKRSKNSLVVCTLHSSSNRHLHFVISSTEYATGKVIRKTKGEFKKIKIDMEQWQDRGLRLTHSRVNHSKKKSFSKDAEYQINLRGNLSEKQQIAIVLSETFYKSSSSMNFYENLEGEGIKLYKRGGKTCGIVGTSRRFRFKTLGYSEDRVLLLDDPKFQRKKELELLREKQTIKKSLNKGK